jgi:hypothetical protein
MAKFHDSKVTLEAYSAAELANNPALAARRTRFFRSMRATMPQLRAYLSAGPLPCKIVEHHFLASGHSRGVLKRAKLAARVLSTKIGKVWYWSLSPISAEEKRDLAWLRN